MSSLMEKLLKNSSIENTAPLSKSDILRNKPADSTGVYIMDLALSGKLVNGGLKSGCTGFAGASKHFKTGFALLNVAAYLKAHEDAICLFYDNEGGAATEFFDSYGIDKDRVIHSFFQHLEELKFDISSQLDNISKGDKVIIFIDSLGNAASKKEAQDALNKNSAADMTRAKEMKSVFRIITPLVVTRDIPLVYIQHTYKDMGLYPKEIVSGGQGGTLASNTVIVIGKRQVKDGKELLGSEFVMKIDKSRYIKEQSVLPITVTYDQGINKYSGLLEIALKAGVVKKPKQGWYARTIVKDDKNWRAKETACDEFWKPILENESQVKLIEDLYSLSSSKLIKEDDLDEIVIDEDTGEVLDKE